MFVSIINSIALLWAASVEFPVNGIPLNGVNSSVAVEASRIYFNDDGSISSIDFSTLYSSSGEEWNVDSIICMDEPCFSGFAVLSEALNNNIQQLAFFERSNLENNISLVVDRGYNSLTQIAVLDQSRILVLTNQSIRFAYPGPCGTRACQALGSSLLLMEKKEDGNWHPERIIRRYSPTDETLRLLQLAEIGGSAVILEAEANGIITRHMIDNSLVPTQRNWPVGRSYRTSRDSILVNIVPNSSDFFTKGVALGVLPGRCFFEDCLREDVVPLIQLDDRENGRQLHFSRDGVLYLIEYLDGVARLYTIRDSNDGGIKQLIEIVDDEVALYFQGFLDRDGVGVISQPYGGPRQLWQVNGAFFPPQIDLVSSRSQLQNFDVEIEVSGMDIGSTEDVYYRRLVRTELADQCVPTIISAYGGFGLASLPREFYPLEEDWLEAGGAIVLVSVRGDGAYGPEWSQAGMEDRWNTINDLRNAVEELQLKGLTNSSGTVLFGGSFGANLALAVGSQLNDSVALTLASAPPIDLSSDNFGNGITNYFSLSPEFESPPPEHQVILAAYSDDQIVPEEEVRLWYEFITSEGGNAQFLEFSDLPHRWRGRDDPRGVAVERELLNRIYRELLPTSDCGFINSE